jgi:hypothetical protein
MPLRSLRGRRYSLYSFMTSAVDGGERSSRLGCALAPGKQPRYPLCRRLGGLQSQSEHRGWRKNPLPLPGSNPVRPVLSQAPNVGYPGRKWWGVIGKDKLTLEECLFVPQCTHTCVYADQQLVSYAGFIQKVRREGRQLLRHCKLACCSESPGQMNRPDSMNLRQFRSKVMSGLNTPLRRRVFWMSLDWIEWLALQYDRLCSDVWTIGTRCIEGCTDRDMTGKWNEFVMTRFSFND